MKIFSQSGRQRCLLLLLPAVLLAAEGPSLLESRFAQLRNDPPSLYAFLLRMPKGADLHNHVSGAIYAESYLRAAAADGNCLNTQTGAIVRPDESGNCGVNTPASRLTTDNNLRNFMIDSLSMR